MKEWTLEERYRVLNSADDIKDLYERISKSWYRQRYHIQPVTGLSSDPNGFVFHDGIWHLSNFIAGDFEISLGRGLERYADRARFGIVSSPLNTVLCLLAVVYGYPRMLLHRIFVR